MKHKEKQLEYVHQYQTVRAKEWRKVVFSDKKKFILDGSDGFCKYWHAKAFPKENYSRHNGGGSLMVVVVGGGGGFSYSGKQTTICQCSAKRGRLCEDTKWFISRTKRASSMWRRVDFSARQCWYPQSIINKAVLAWTKSKTSWPHSVLSRPQPFWKFEAIDCCNSL